MPGPEIVVGVVDRADDAAVADHRRGLQIVAGEPQLHHVQQVLRLLAEAALGQRLDDVDDGDAARLDRLADDGDIARHEALASRPSPRRTTTLAFMSAVGVGEAELLEHGGDRVDRARAQVDGALLRQRRQAAIGLEVALQDEDSPPAPRR